jgi:hypothetical protein
MRLEHELYPALPLPTLQGEKMSLLAVGTNEKSYIRRRRAEVVTTSVSINYRMVQSLYRFLCDTQM